MKNNSSKPPNRFSLRPPRLRESNFRISIKTILLGALCVLCGQLTASAAETVEAEGRAAGDQRTAWPDNYPTYLEQIDDVAKSLRVKPDQIELFLYLIGPTSDEDL